MRPSFLIIPPDQEPCGDIYNPCELPGIGVVVQRRQPGGPIEWPDGARCDEILGGCFPPDQPPILGPEPFYNKGGSVNTFINGSAHSGSVSAKFGGGFKLQIVAAIRSIDIYDKDDVCQPIIDDLLERLDAGGIWIAVFGSPISYAAGEWVGKEAGTSASGGTIYINTAPAGGNWNEDGTVNERQLRKTLTEEGIHAYFDTDVSHTRSATEEELAAMNKMRTACGKWN